MSLADEDDAALASGSAAAAPGRAWSCPSRFRRRRRASRPRGRVSVTPSTAFTWPTVRRSKPRLIGNQTLQVLGRARLPARRPARRAARPSARRPAACACRGAAGAAKISATGPCSTISPFCHDADPVGDLAHDAEVVGDEQHRHAELRSAARSAASRICAWMVTSSAVVGSSAISRSGSLASAMAIITRWRWPPESWCG